MAGLFSKLFDSADPAKSDDLPVSGGGESDHAPSSDGGGEGRSDEDSASGSQSAGAEAHAEADVTVALHNESEVSWQNAEGDSHSYGRSMDVETGQQVGAGFSSESGLTLDDGF